MWFKKIEKVEDLKYDIYLVNKEYKNYLLSKDIRGYSFIDLYLISDYNLSQNILWGEPLINHFDKISYTLRIMKIDVVDIK